MKIANVSYLLAGLIGGWLAFTIPQVEATHAEAHQRIILHACAIVARGDGGHPFVNSAELEMIEKECKL